MALQAPPAAGTATRGLARGFQALERRRQARAQRVVMVQEGPEEVERVTLDNSAAWVILVMTGLGLAMAAYWFGWPIWATATFALCAAAVILRAGSVAGGVVVGYLTQGAILAHYLYGFPAWPTMILGVAAIYVVGTHVSSQIGSQATSGDQNPVYMVAIIVAARAYLATALPSIAAVTSTPGWLDWLAVFVLGIVPGFPTVVNILLFVVLNGTLTIYVVLLAKRIVNPLAN